MRYVEGLNTVSAEVWPKYVIRGFPSFLCHTAVEDPGFPIQGWGGCANPKRGGTNLLFDKIYAKNCIEIKEIGPGCVPMAPGFASVQ